MGQHFTRTAIRKQLAWWAACAALIGAVAAMMLPTVAADTPEIATVLAVGALAMLAGHAWGLLIVAAADVMLLGKVWPLVVFADNESSSLVAGIALLGALPGLLLLSRTLPGTVEVLLGRTDPRLRSAGVTCGGVLAAIWLVLPVL